MLVDREWRLASQIRGTKYIDPVPLENPQIAPPPDEINNLNFEDKYLAYMAYARTKAKV
jgi:hypothetical protein